MKQRLRFAIGCAALVIPLTGAQAGSTPPHGTQASQHEKASSSSAVSYSSRSQYGSNQSGSSAGGGLNNSVAAIGRGGGSGGRGQNNSGNVLVQSGDSGVHRHPVDPPLVGHGTNYPSNTTGQTVQGGQSPVHGADGSGVYGRGTTPTPQGASGPGVPTPVTAANPPYQQHDVRPGGPALRPSREWPLSVPGAAADQTVEHVAVKRPIPGLFTPIPRRLPSVMDEPVGKTSDPPAFIDSNGWCEGNADSCRGQVGFQCVKTHDCGTTSFGDIPDSACIIADPSYGYCKPHLKEHCKVGEDNYFYTCAPYNSSAGLPPPKTPNVNIDLRGLVQGIKNIDWKGLADWVAKHNQQPVDGGTFNGGGAENQPNGSAPPANGGSQQGGGANSPQVNVSGLNNLNLNGLPNLNLGKH